MVFVSLFVLTSSFYSQSNTVFMSFEMISNGNGVITDVVGFDITRAPQDHGAYSADWYRDVLQGGASILNLPDGMQAGGGWYFIVAGPNTITDHESAVNRWTRNGALDNVLEGNTYEIRFTEAGGKAIMRFTTGSLVDVPFEIWYLSSTPNDPLDDVRMVPWIYDDHGYDIFNFELDHQASGAENDPYSDWIYFRMPDDNSPGESGYNQFVQDVMNGTYDYGGEEHLARLVLMNWNQHQYESSPGAGDGSVEASPENGTTFRLSVADVTVITIDIKPGSDPNSINCGNLKGIIPVAILTTSDFDATQVDPFTVRFGPTEAQDIHGTGHIEDVDADGDPDMVLHFRFGDTGIQCNHTQATLKGETFGGSFFAGTDAIHLVPALLVCDISDPGEHDYNKVRLLVGADGRIARNDERDAHAFFPFGTCDQYIFAAGPIVGGLVSGTPIVAEATYSSEFVASDIGTTGQPFRVFNSTFTNDRKNWPPEFSKSNGKPIIVNGAQNLVVQYNDVDGTPVRDVTTPLGIEVRQRSLAYKDAKKRNAIIFIWEITNVSTNNIDNAYFGFWADHDIGFGSSPNGPFDDRGSVVDDMAIIWDDDFSEPEFSEQAAIMGFNFLETPDNAGVANFSLFGGAISDADQSTDANQYAVLSGPASFEVGGVVGDIRFLVSTGPFDLEEGSKAVLAGAILFGRAPEGTTQLDVDPVTFRPDPNDVVLADLLNIQDQVQQFYDQQLRGQSLPKLSEFAEETEISSVPKEYSLSQNYPNPFNPATTIHYTLPEDNRVELSIYNTLGQKVATLVNDHQPAGEYQLQWQPQDISSGIYIISFTAGDYHQIRKLLFVK
jgi:hypothetical protein